MGLASIFDDHHPVLRSEFQNQVHRRRQAVKMDGENGAGAGGDRAGDLGGVKVGGARVNIHKYRSRAHIQNRFDGRDKRVGGGDHLIPGLDAQRQQRQVQGAGAGIYRNAMLDATESGEFPLEFLHLFTQNK